MLALVFFEHPAVDRAEDELAAKVSLPLQRRQYLIAKWNLTRFATLRRRNDIARDRASNLKLAGSEIDIFPPQCQQLALAKSSAKRDQNHASPFAVGAGDQSVRFVKVQKIELRLRVLEPLDVRDAFDRATLGH